MAKHCIGLDIGSSAVKLVQLRPAGRKLRLQNFGLEPVAPQTIVDGVILNYGALVEAIKTLVKRIDLRGKAVALAVSGNSVIIKRLTIPAMDGPALDEQMEWEVRQNIPFSRDDVLVDYEVLVKQTPAGQMEVLLVAAKREIVGQYMQVVRDAGLQPVIVDAAALALQNALEGGVGTEQGATVAIINVGANYSTLSIVANGRPSFNRDLGVAGNTYTEAIQRHLGVSLDGAEAYKVGGTAESPGSTGADMVPQEVHRLLWRVSEQVAEEFQRSIDFYINDAVDARISRIYLSGGSALVPQLAKAVQDRAQIPVKILDPLVNIEIDPHRFDVEYIRANAPVATVAFGLALRHPGDSA